jgi:hypothetical protein
MLSSFLHEPEGKGNRGDRPSWWISSYRFVSDPIGERGIEPPRRGRFAFRLRTRGQTSTLIGDWRHPFVGARCTHPGGPSFDFERSDKETTTRHGRRGGSWLPAYRLGDAKRMSQLTSAPETAEQTQLSRLGVSIRGKLQFMDYLIRAALADAQRYQDENDPGTRIFIRQLVEMHTANLRLESQNLRLTGELCAALEAMVDSGSEPHATGDLS